MADDNSANDDGNLQTYSPGSSPEARDKHITKTFLEFLASSNAKEPFFSFLFYDAVHAKQSPRGSEKVFTPVWERPNYLALNNDFNPEPFRNMYRNSLFYTDQKIGKVLAALKQHDLMKNTVVLITSDHGEEFNDNHKNYWGHGSNYSDAQIHVPLYMYMPSVEPRTIAKRTSHLDVMPSLMKHVLNVSTPIDDHSNGEDLLDSQTQRQWLVTGSYSDYALVSVDEINHVRVTGKLDTMNPDLSKKSKRTLQADDLKAILRGQSRFLAISP